MARIPRLILVTTLPILMTEGQIEAMPRCDDPSMSLLEVALAARTWADLDEVSRCVRYGEDDGAVSEAISDRVGTLLASQWDTLPELQRLVAQRPEFQRFVIRHIDITLTAERLAAIEQNADKRCPATSTALCQEISLATKSIKQ
jgi:hypothetical protein